MLLQCDSILKDLLVYFGLNPSWHPAFEPSLQNPNTESPHKIRGDKADKSILLKQVEK